MDKSKSIHNSKSKKLELTLTTYDSIVSYNAGYAHSTNAIEFTKILSENATKFSNEVGVPIKSVHWIEVTQSDWCRNMIIFYATVKNDWKPIDNTMVIDEVRDEHWSPDSVKSFSDFIRGDGTATSLINHKPTNLHNLFQSVLIKK